MYIETRDNNKKRTKKRGARTQVKNNIRKGLINERSRPGGDRKKNYNN